MAYGKYNGQSGKSDYSKNVNMIRKIMLVDTVIKGEVPSSYLGVPHS